MPQLPYTLCWNCSASYPMQDAKCPKCGMTNANADQEAALAELQQQSAGLRPCPACPDGNVWGINGPIGKTCPVCLGTAEVNLDGSRTAEAIELDRKRARKIRVNYLRGEDDE